MPWIRRFLFAFLLLGPAAAAAQEAPAPAPADLSLFVFDGDLPVPNIQVSVDGQPRARTNANGATWLLVEEGAHTLTLTREDGRTIDIQVELAADENMRVIATLPRVGGIPIVDIQSSQGRDALMTMREEAMEGPTGTLMGRVISAQDGGPVAGARVFVSGTPVEAKTDEQGRFQVALPSGTYSVSVIHGDYSTQTKDDLQVAVGQTTSTRIAITPAGLELQEYTVTVPYIPGTVASTISQQKEATGVTEVIGANRMSRSGDADAGDALQRVTGLTVVGSGRGGRGRFVVIRGQPSRYTSTTLNGSRLPSPDPMRRIVPLDLFPTGILSGIKVQKSYAADKIGTFGAGLIDLRTRKIPDTGFAALGIGTGVNTQSTGKSGLDSPGGSTDFLGVDDGTRSLPKDPLQQSIDANTFGNNDHEIDPRTLGPDRSLSVSAGGKVNTSLGDYGAVASLKWSQEWRHRVEDWTTFSLGGGELQENTSFTRERTDMKVSLGGMLSLGGEWGEDNSVTSNTFLLRKTRGRDQIRDGRLSAEFDRSREFRLFFNRRELLLQQLTGEHNLWGLGLNWRVLGGKAKRELPDRRTYTFNEVNDEFLLRREIGLERRFNTVDDDILASDADLTIPLGEYGWLTKAQAKVGVSVSRKDRTNETFVFSLLPTDEADLTERPNELFDPADQGDKFTIRNDTVETDNYTGALDITEQYAMLDLELFEDLKLNLGLRRSEATIEINPRGDSPNAGFNQVRNLPGVSITWNFLEDMNLRAAYSETYSLPLLTEIAPVNFTDPDSGRAFQGNPDLKPTEIKALDVRWEWYPSRSELLTVGWFLKDYNNPIERSFADLAGGDRTLNQMRNFDQADIIGVEFGGRMEIDERLGIWPGTFIRANATFVDSTVTTEDAGIATNEKRALQGQAPYVFNLQTGYDSEDLDLTLSFNVVGRRLFQAGIQGLPDIFIEPVKNLDFAAQYKATEGLFFRFKAGNLLNPTIKFTQGGRNFRSFTRGRNFSVSAGYRF